MSNIEPAPSTALPRVEESDIHLVAIDELLDPDNHERWVIFARENPMLARVVLLEANRLEGAGESIEQAAINIATFTVAALKHALARSSEIPPATNVDGEGLLP